MVDMVSLEGKDGWTAMEQGADEEGEVGELLGGRGGSIPSSPTTSACWRRQGAPGPW